jgi:hypothetical protein
VQEEKMAGETSVDASTSRHARPRVAEGEGPANAKAAPANRPVSSGISGLVAAAHAKVREYEQADAELAGKLARIDESALAPDKKTDEKRRAIISVAQLRQEADDAVLDQQRDTPLGRAKYAESYVNELGEELDKARKTGVFTDANLAEKYDEAVSNNLARWRVALRNAVAVHVHMLDPDDPLFKSCKAGLRRAEELASKQLNPRQLNDAIKLELVGIPEEIDEAKKWLAEDKRDGKTGKFWSDHVKALEQERSDLVTGKIAPGLHQSPLELAKAARQELTAKSKQLDDARALLADVESGRAEESVVRNYVSLRQKEYRAAVVSNFAAAGGAANYALYLKPPNEVVKDAAERNFREANDLLMDVAPELAPMR